MFFKFLRQPLRHRTLPKLLAIFLVAMLGACSHAWATPAFGQRPAMGINPFSANEGRSAKREKVQKSKSAKARAAKRKTAKGNKDRRVHATDDRTDVQTAKLAPMPSAKRAATARNAGVAEARLIEVYRLIGAGQSAKALTMADSLVIDFPNFQLAQLVHGDLLASRSRPISRIGDVPDSTARHAVLNLADLREESRQRMQALRDRPPADTSPSAFLSLGLRNKHAIAVDVSRSRLYLFENTPQGPKLLSDFYVSVGKAGAEKFAEGDLRTPLGVYFLNASLDPRSLKDLYGAGALTMNYPNPLDTRRGKAGSGIWLHGTPAAQFSRAPKATDGCIVVANPDFLKIASLVEMRNTPIVVAQQLQWTHLAALEPERRNFLAALEAWRIAKSKANVSQWLNTYAPDFKSFEKTLREWYPAQEAALKAGIGQPVELKDLSMLQWRDAPGAQQPIDAMVVTFTEVRVGSKNTPVVRQYWSRSGGQWKIVFEGVIS